MVTSTQRAKGKKCIFCGGGGVPGNPMTEEHLWPEWMHSYLPQVSDMKTTSAHRRVRFGAVSIEEKTREGAVFTRRFRLVCKRCNGGWMSGIETDVKPILIPLLRAQTKTLLKNDRIKLARWIALKVMVTECINESDAVMTEFERADFMGSRKIPRGLRIFVGTHNSLLWYTGYWHQTLLAHIGPTPPPQAHSLGKFKNIQTTAIGIGHLFVLCFITTLGELKLSPISRRNFLRLWPLRSQPILWPLENLSDRETGRLANCIRELVNSPIARWLPYPQ